MSERALTAFEAAAELHGAACQVPMEGIHSRRSIPKEAAECTQGAPLSPFPTQLQNDDQQHPSLSLLGPPRGLCSPPQDPEDSSLYPSAYPPSHARPVCLPRSSAPPQLAPDSTQPDESAPPLSNAATLPGLQALSAQLPSAPRQQRSAVPSNILGPTGQTSVPWDPMAAGQRLRSTAKAAAAGDSRVPPICREDPSSSVRHPVTMCNRQGENEDPVRNSQRTSTGGQQRHVALWPVGDPPAGGGDGLPSGDCQGLLEGEGGGRGLGGCISEWLREGLKGGSELERQLAECLGAPCGSTSRRVQAERPRRPFQPIQAKLRAEVGAGEVLVVPKASDKWRGSGGGGWGLLPISLSPPPLPVPLPLPSPNPSPLPSPPFPLLFPFPPLSSNLLSLAPRSPSFLHHRFLQKGCLLMCTVPRNVTAGNRRFRRRGRCSRVPGESLSRPWRT